MYTLYLKFTLPSLYSDKTSRLNECKSGNPRNEAYTLNHVSNDYYIPVAVDTSWYYMYTSWYYIYTSWHYIYTS